MVVLLAFAGIEILRERRPTFLRSGVRLNAYIGNIDDGTVTVVDLVRLAPRNRTGRPRSQRHPRESQA